MKISVFGGSQPEEGTAAYAEAQTLGRLLAQAGHTTMTGGYVGTMEAVSRGAAEAGGHVIGVTCAEIERWRPIAANRWVREEWKKDTLLERLEALIQNCDAALALPGGPGTLAEITLTWNLMIVHAIARKPLVLIGPAWQSVLDQIVRSLGEYVPASQRDLLQFAPDAASAMGILKTMN
jgi:uncharacterized protein (TIGR00730 family)